MPSPSPRPRNRDPGSLLPLAASVVAHAVVVGLLALIPKPPPGSGDPLGDLELIELVEMPEAEPRLPGPPPTPPTPPTQDVDAQSDDVKPTPRRIAPRGQPGPPTGTAGEPDDAPTPEEPKSGGLALLGLRDQSRSTAGAVVESPELTWSFDTAGERPRVGPPRADDATPRPRDDSPRSLGEAGFQRQRNGKIVARGPGFKAFLQPDGRVKFRNIVRPSQMPGMSEAIRAAQGQDIYQRAKKRLLERTFELRLRMAVTHAKKQIDRELARLYRDLLDGWSKSTPAADRRRALFVRWDECDEAFAIKLPEFARERKSEVSEIDEARAAAGQQARDTIERFIRRHLPAGSSDAYTSSELQKLNQRRKSTQRFDPYRK